VARAAWYHRGEPDGSSRLASHHAASAWVVDDFGDRLRVRRCGDCRTWLPEGEEHFAPRKRHATGHVIRYDGWCRPCRNRSVRERQAAKSAAERSAEYAARWARDKQNAEHLESKRKRNRAAQRRWRAAHPQRARAVHAQWLERVKQDPARLRALRESQRIGHRERMARQGREVRTVRAVTDERTDGGRKVDAQEFPKLPAAALLAWIEERVRIEDRGRRVGLDVPERSSRGRDTGAKGYVCTWLGVDERRVTAWRNGEAERVDFDLADRILTRGGVCWWDVWDASNTDEHGLRLVARAFEGDPDAAEQLDLWESAA
jgi:hypothetical protein